MARRHSGGAQCAGVERRGGAVARRARQVPQQCAARLSSMRVRLSQLRSQAPPPAQRARRGRTFCVSCSMRTSIWAIRLSRSPSPPPPPPIMTVPPPRVLMPAASRITYHARRRTSRAQAGAYAQRRWSCACSAARACAASRMRGTGGLIMSLDSYKAPPVPARALLPKRPKPRSSSMP